MNTQELLNVADKVVYKAFGKHLTDLQTQLLKAACENQTYEEFANIYGYCLDYIKKDVGCVLWHLLSEALGEKVTKKNFRQALERYQQAEKLPMYHEKTNKPDFAMYLMLWLSWEAHKTAAIVDHQYQTIDAE
ncbi:hypothetical protein [Nostoc sp. CENA543]|uniref:hypothetical protein n=1 Tax=Nostoc sp. CENA543 TaxID=1869241 RepID=UPI001CEFAFA4|nr:hypothetical protein [Nostoc sp. CENA543]